jgi:hypothetical protein
MTERDTLRDAPQSKTSETPAATKLPDVAPKPPSQTEPVPTQEFDPFRFQANTVPPGLRQELVAALPHRIEPERWANTVPPAEIWDRLRSESEEPPEAEEPVEAQPEESEQTALSSGTDDGRNADTVVLPRVPLQGPSTWLVWAVVAGIACAGLAFFLTWSATSPPAIRTATTPSATLRKTKLTEVRAAASPTPPVRAQAGAQPLQSAPAAAASAHAPSATGATGSLDPRRAPRVAPTAAPLPSATARQIAPTKPSAPATPPARAKSGGIFEQPFKPPAD